MTLIITSDDNNLLSKDPNPPFLLNLHEYFDLNHKLLSSLSRLHVSQFQLFDLINGRFEIFDIIVRDLLLSNKTRKKKYLDLYQEETSRLLQKTANLFHSFNNDQLPYEVYNERMPQLAKEILREIEKLKQNGGKEKENKVFLKPNGSFRKKESDDDIADVKSSRRDVLSSNRLLISAKTKAFDSVLSKDFCAFSMQKTKYFNERSQIHELKPKLEKVNESSQIHELKPKLEIIDNKIYSCY